MSIWRRVAFGAVAIISGPAIAGDVPLYDTVPSWVTSVKLAQGQKQSAAGGPILLDLQQRIEGPTVWSFVDMAMSLDTPEALSQSNNITLPWNPDKGDLIVHQLTIIRGTEEIDVLASGQKFTVLRREQQLERRELTGILTATIAVEGLRVGDVLRLRFSTTMKDKALNGRAQVIQSLIAEPFVIPSAGYRLLWGEGDKVKSKIFAEKVRSKRERKGTFEELAIELPLPKQSDLPSDAPGRFNNPQIIESSTFEDWADVSKVMAPLYATDGLLPPGSAVLAEVEAIMSATQDPMVRTAKALQLVQDKIRYLAVGMDGGNYIPQSPSKTWEVRYGDCKAKTLLLLAMLDVMNIEAEPVLTHTVLGDIVPLRVPSALAFNHILVRATINGESLFLDGTGLGSRIEDVRDTPALGHLLPLRLEGAELMKMDIREPARATIDLTLDADESTSVDLPSVADVTMVVRGELANTLTLASTQLAEKEKQAFIDEFLQRFVGEAQYETLSATVDSDRGTVVLKGKGVFNSGWEMQDRRSEKVFSRAPDLIAFEPDRARPAWANIPVLTAGPELHRFRMRIKLPDGGRGFVMEGDANLQTEIGGVAIKRAANVENGILTVDETFSYLGKEIPASQISVERDLVTTTLARSPRLIAPADTRRRWELEGANSLSQLNSIKAVYKKTRADADVDNISPLTSSWSFLNGIGDYRGASEILTQQIAILPSADAYLSRASARYELGDAKGALSDAQEARKLDPSSSSAVVSVATYTAELGELDKAVALLDERIALGGKTRDEYRSSKASLLGEHGKVDAALSELDRLNLDKPGTPSLLNERCWLKGTQNIELPSALKDCTSAIELSESSTTILDSRALVWFRMGRYEEALQDLDAVLLQAPGFAESRFLRSIVYARLGKAKEAATDLAVARRMSPSVERKYARFGLKH